MQQVFFGGNPIDLLHTTTAEQNVIHGGRSVWSITAVRQVISAPGTFKQLNVVLSGAPGAGKSYTFVLRVNGVDSALSVQISDANTSGTITTDVAVVAGDYIDIQCTPAGTPTAVYAKWASLFEGTTANESNILGGFNISSSVTTHYRVTGYGPNLTAENDARQVVPTAGTIRDFFVLLAGAPGEGNSRTYNLRVNRVNKLTVTISDTDTSGSDTSSTVAVVGGDVITIQHTVSGTPAPGAPAWGLTFVASVDGESILTGGSSIDLNAAATEYNSVPTANTGWDATEADKQLLGLACTLKKLYILLSGTAGLANSYTFDVRDPGGNTGIQVVISGPTQVAGNDIVNTHAITDGETICLQVIPDSTPTVRDAYWGLVCYIAPPVAAGRSWVMVVG